MSALPPPKFRAVEVYPVLAPAASYVANGDWASIRLLFDSLSHAGRSGLAGVLLDEKSIEALVRSVLERDPYEPYANTLLGAHLINQGWEIRGSGRASTVSREQFEALHDHLRRAEQLLIDVAARDPSQVLAWRYRLTTSMGLQMTTAESRRRYDQAAKYAPHDYWLQSTLLQDLCRKWGGSDELMFGFARECGLAAPEGAHSSALVAEAHIEKWLDLPNDESGPYMRSEEVRADLRRFAERSVWHPNFSHDFGWVGALSEFAMAFSLADDYAAAAHCFTLMGEFGSAGSWGYLSGKAEETFVKYRDLAFEKGSAK